MTEEPRWKSRLRAWHARPPGLPAEEARRRILRELERQERPGRRPASSWLGAQQRFLLATLGAAAAFSLAVLLFPTDRHRPAPVPSHQSSQETSGQATGLAGAQDPAQAGAPGYPQTNSAFDAEPKALRRGATIVLELPSGSTLHLTHLLHSPQNLVPQENPK